MAKTEIFQPNPNLPRPKNTSRLFELANIMQVVYTPHARTNNSNHLDMRPENNEFYPDELRLREVLSQGISMLIPRQHLHGRQSRDGYERRKRESVERNLRRDGIEFLLKNPIIACALPVQGGLKIVVVDGHHRVRYSTGFGINNIPSILYSPQQIVDAFNLRNSTRFDVNALTKQLETEQAEAYSSFRSLPDIKLPRIVAGCNNIQDLPFKRL